MESLQQDLFDDIPIRQEKKNSIKKKYVYTDAIFSDDKKYRYSLTRIWDESKPYYIWIMLNPSDADAIVDDPTIRRCINFSKDSDAGGIIVINLFARIETYSNRLYPHYKAGCDIVGEKNCQYFDRYCTIDHMIICAWGNIPKGLKIPKYKSLIQQKDRLFCLHRNSTGWPTHPLYLSRNNGFSKYEFRGENGL